jgi:hypothetical protein
MGCYALIVIIFIEAEAFPRSTSVTFIEIIQLPTIFGTPENNNYY